MRLAPLSWLVFVCSFAPPLRGEDTFVGCVKSAQGNPVIRRMSGTIPATEGMHLLLNDVLVTSANGRLGVILGDGTRISLGPNTELTVDRFVYEPANGKFGMLLRLAQGVFAYVSGRIARLSPQSVTVETPVGVIGLRGTKFAVSIEGK
jgi:hypothetical protein